MVIALGTAILTETWPSSERGKAIGFAAGFISLGIVVGPALGGLILEWLSWHWVFFVNLPFGIAALVMVLLYVPPLLPTGKAERFDFLGAGVLGLTLLSYAVNLFLLAMGRLATHLPPIVQPGRLNYVDPVPQALVLTAIVIGFGMTAFVIALALCARKALGSDHVDGDRADP